MPRYYMGVDWADQAHAVWVGDEHGTSVWERTVPHTVAGFSDWGRWEDSFPADEKFQSLFAEVVDPKGPIVTPFERTVLTSVP